MKAVVLSKVVEGNTLKISTYCPLNNTDMSSGVYAFEDPSNYFIEKIVNRTPHEITMYKDVNGDQVIDFVLCKDDNPLRVTSEIVPIEFIDGVRTTRTVFGKCEDLPEVQPDVYYIVSAIVKIAHPDRTDLLTVNESVRDENGRVIGCKSLSV